MLILLPHNAEEQSSASCAKTPKNGENGQTWLPLIPVTQGGEQTPISSPFPQPRWSSLLGNVPADGNEVQRSVSSFAGTSAAKSGRSFPALSSWIKHSLTDL